MKKAMLLTILALFCSTQLAIAQPGHSKWHDDQRREREELELRETRLELAEREAKLDAASTGAEVQRGCRKSGGGCSGGNCASKRKHGEHCFLFLVYCGIVHILLTIWVFADIRKRNAGSGIWIVVTLMTGLLGALVYAVVRMGDPRPQA